MNGIGPLSFIPLLMRHSILFDMNGPLLFIPLLMRHSILFAANYLWLSHNTPINQHSNQQYITIVDKVDC